MMMLKYLEFSGGLETEIDHDQYQADEKKLKLYFIDQIQPLNTEKFLLAYLGFRQEKYKQEKTKKGFCFYSHLEKLFQEELVVRKMTDCVISENNNNEDGFSAVEKRLIKRFKLIRALDNRTLIERYIILTNRKIERFHEEYCGLDQDPSSSQVLSRQNWFELCVEEHFLAQELKNRSLQVPEMGALVQSNAITFIGG